MMGFDQEVSFEVAFNPKHYHGTKGNARRMIVA